ncbi:hypothetical protein HZU77_005765 [Neisseriaceae bacterium TC5R-5]|nr:hypothetical protein [Neisseriaceae bacterium TC5R-5]
MSARMLQMLALLSLSGISVAACLPQAWICTSPIESMNEAGIGHKQQNVQTLAGLHLERDETSNRFVLEPAFNLNEDSRLSFKLTPKRIGLHLKVRFN